MRCGRNALSGGTSVLRTELIILEFDTLIRYVSCFYTHQTPSLWEAITKCRIYNHKAFGTFGNKRASGGYMLLDVCRADSSEESGGMKISNAQGHTPSAHPFGSVAGCVELIKSNSTPPRRAHSL